MRPYLNARGPELLDTHCTCCRAWRPSEETERERESGETEREKDESFEQLSDFIFSFVLSHVRRLRAC